ncbi:GTP-binding protein HSR1-related protein [[Leptolyngbya] sp. PCC 7376]|uniref:GTP-binding protein n=1 Tax=[Leptolyngbya] sp. PCC 7376 TaxID=111781 RepID=UPI00029EDA99|nr:GTP-binding protein [[Leptolyngbya] sp. PCC 7376]AFY38715.1 GTP-binding protein HSR1-related protein [[Leptolyngbya] sp. PCC 7376]
MEKSADWSSEEFDAAIADFTEIQTDINYHEAQETLKQLLQNLDLTEREQYGLQQDIQQLGLMFDKLEHSVLQIAAFGLVGRGKSSVLNALLGESVFQTGALHGVTTEIGQAIWQVSEENIGDSRVQRVSLSDRQHSRLELVDTPGIDEVNGETREQLAKLIAQQMDLILFVVAGDMSRVEFEALSQLREVGKPMILVFNKVDQYPETDRELIYQTICDRRVKEILSPDEIVMVAASPLVAKVSVDATGKRQVTRERGQSNVVDLKLKILEILEREGKALLALNSMLFADATHKKVLQRKLLLRERASDHLIEKAMVTKAAAVALNPVTVLDIFSGAMVDVVLIIRLSQLYGLNLQQTEAIALLQKIALSMGGMTAGEFIANLGLSSLKGMLGFSIPATGGLSLAPYISVAITQGAIAGLSTKIIGEATKSYLITGGAWGDNNPKAVVRKIIDSLDRESILYRLKQDLTANLRS